MYWVYIRICVALSTSCNSYMGILPQLVVLTTDLFDYGILADYYLLHCSYLSALISQSFLDIGSVSRILDSIMKLCLQFCWSIEHYETGANMFEIDHITEVSSYPTLLAFSKQIRDVPRLSPALHESLTA
jgi:hypothetical protein